MLRLRLRRTLTLTCLRLRLRLRANVDVDAGVEAHVDAPWGSADLVRLDLRPPLLPPSFIFFLPSFMKGAIEMEEEGQTRSTKSRKCCFGDDAHLKWRAAQTQEGVTLIAAWPKSIFVSTGEKIDFGHAALRVTPPCACAAHHLRWASTPKQHFRDFVERVCPSSFIQAPSKISPVDANSVMLQSAMA